MKRFTETDKWKDGWFLSLTPQEKLLFFYLFENCDSAGVFEIVIPILEVFVGSSIRIDEFLDKAGDRIQKLDDGKYWLSRFCKIQYPGGVSPSAKVHSKVRHSIQKHKLPEPIGNLSNTYSIPIPDLSNRSQDKDKEEVEDKEKVEDKSHNFSTLQNRIAKLGNWSPHLNYSEQSDLADNSGKWFDLTDRDWNTLESWYAVPASAAPYRSGKAKLLRSPDEEVIKAESNGFPKASKSKAKLSPKEKAEMNQKLFGETVIATDSP